jgi:hypothetical protein
VAALAQPHQRDALQRGSVELEAARAVDGQ